MSLVDKIKNLCSLFTTEIFGFISPSVDIEKDIEEYMTLIEEGDESLVIDFENDISKFLGGGKVVSFASGRMAFYSLLKSWGISKGDEVVLTGFTCSVMVNAVLRVEAKPVYVDIDPDTLGMSPIALMKCITKSTKVIVAQHTFGIPCKIDAIRDIAEKRGIHLVEDCALSFGSKYKGITIGNWGEAAIFSTDHTKPLNTLIGGFVYTTNGILEGKIRAIQAKSGELSKNHQRAILKRYIKEHIMEKRGHNYYILDNYVTVLMRKLHLSQGLMPYLQYEASTNTEANPIYPYPAKMPAVLARIGINSLEDYKKSVGKRTRILNQYLRVFEETGYIPKAYYDNTCEIVPLRFAFTINNRDSFDFIDNWIWFKKPIVASEEPIERFGYKTGMCPVSENVGETIMNFPILLDYRRHNRLFKRLKKYLNGI